MYVCVHLSARQWCQVLIPVMDELLDVVGPDGSPRLTDLCNEAGEEGASPGSAVACGQVRQCDLVVRPRLLHSETPPEDRGRSADYCRSPGSTGEDGTGRMMLGNTKKYEPPKVRISTIFKGYLVPHL